MLDKQTRGAILVLRGKGHSLHRISQLLSLSRNTVKKVIKIGSDVPPVIRRLRKLDAQHELIAPMLAEFDGSVVKVMSGTERRRYERRILNTNSFLPKESPVGWCLGSQFQFSQLQEACPIQRPRHPGQGS
jgi:biotin operon repressor